VGERLPTSPYGIGCALIWAMGDLSTHVAPPSCFTEPLLRPSTGNPRLLPGSIQFLNQQNKADFLLRFALYRVRYCNRYRYTSMYVVPV